MSPGRSACTAPAARGEQSLIQTPPPRSLAPQPTLTRPWPCRSLPPWQGGPGPPHSRATGHSPPVGGVCSSICPPQHPHPKRGSSPNPGGLEPRGIAPRFTALVCHRFRSRKRRFLAESERRCGAPSELFAPSSRVEFNEPVSCLPLPVTPRPPAKGCELPALSDGHRVSRAPPALGLRKDTRVGSVKVGRRCRNTPGLSQAASPLRGGSAGPDAGQNQPRLHLRLGQTAAWCGRRPQPGRRPAFGLLEERGFAIPGSAGSSAAALPPPRPGGCRGAELGGFSGSDSSASPVTRWVTAARRRFCGEEGGRSPLAPIPRAAPVSLSDGSGEEHQGGRRAGAGA